MTTALAHATAPSSPSGNEGRLVAVDGRELPLAGARLEARARGGLCRAVLVQTFRNPHAEPLRVTYLLPLPHDGAVSGFAFTVGGRRVTGEVDKARKARERFERALVEGRTAALVEQDRTSLFTQELGNVPPGGEVVAELTVDQRLAWRAGAWEWRFPTTIAPRYQGAPGRVPDAGKLEVPVADGPLAVRLTLALTVEDRLAEGGRLESPSHALLATSGPGGLSAALEDGRGVPLDRDVVVRWPVAAPEPGLSLAVTGRPGKGEKARAFGLLTLVPPALTPRTAPRDLVLLFDVSGSMHGEPIDQSRAVALALVDALGPDDRLEMVAFSDAPVRWRARPVAADAAGKRAAVKWLNALAAGGATEMREGIREALRPLREGAGRQVVVFTDGQIGFEQEIVAEILASLPAGSRLHTVGVGDSVNRSLTGPAARAGRGREVVIGLGEAPARAAALLVAHTALPVVTELEVTGSAVKAVAPARPGDLHQGAPSLVALELHPAGGELVVRGRTAEGAFEHRRSVPAAAPGEGPAAVPALFAREAVEDLEARIASGDPDHRRLEAAIEKLGLELQIATRLTSWVAISEEATVDPSSPTRREVMPHALPHGMSAEGLGLRHALPVMAAPARSVVLFQRALVESVQLEDVEAAPMDAEPSLKEEKAKRTRAAKPSAPKAMPPAFSMGPRPAAPAGRAAAHRARIVLREGNRLVLELTLGSEVTWAPPENAMLSDGARLPVLVEGTTGAGTYGPGLVLRVTLETTGTVPPGERDLAYIILSFPGGGTLTATLG
ncbi:MAG: VIT domain-containing protein [Anaeromyxobacteraceae bacterium]